VNAALGLTIETGKALAVLVPQAFTATTEILPFCPTFPDVTTIEFVP
jgi:hypothetical protein